jgi:hypothetical protein
MFGTAQSAGPHKGFYKSYETKQQAVAFKDVFRDVAPCGSSKHRLFGGIYRLHLQGNTTLPSAQLADRKFLTTDGEESLLQQHRHSRVYPLPFSYCWLAVALSNVSWLAPPLRNNMQQTTGADAIQTLCLSFCQRLMKFKICRIWGFRGGGCEECRLQGCASVWVLLGLKFRRNASPSSSGWKESPSEEQRLQLTVC